MAPGHNFVINDLGAAELEELNTDDIEDPDRINVLDPDKSRYVQNLLCDRAPTKCIGSATTEATES
jgi:hypothetical protein